MNRKKVLMLASVASTIEQFNMDNISLLQELGFDVDVACNFKKGSNISDEAVDNFKKRLIDMGVTPYQIDFDRNALNLKQALTAVNQVKKLAKEKGYYAIHCHTPIGSVAGRLAGRKTGAKVIYTAHGFHFFKGAPVKNWVLFYPIEKWLSRYTDMLITINDEDRVRAESKFKAKDYAFIHGVGIDTKDVAADKDSNPCPVILSVGELNDNKNHSAIIKALSEIQASDWKYLICGQGKKEKELKELADSLGIGNRVELLGYRSDVKDILKKADLFVFPSFREGLSVALMEAMAAGLPVVASDIRGNRDLITPDKGGILVNPDDVMGFADAIGELLGDLAKRDSMGRFNMNFVKNYDITNVHEEMRAIYKKVLGA